MLSRPSYTEGAASDVCAITVDMLSRKSSDIRKGQLEDEELKKIIDCFDSMDKDENFANYTSRGYLMNQDILYRYSPESEEEAQLVVPAQERERILQEYHDAPPRWSLWCREHLQEDIIQILFSRYEKVHLRVHQDLSRMQSL
ncbi:retrovirus-related Pol polyprotein from transposon 17.6 [Trichonephila clavipes]|uniref:Retrovirus-related Pol polyprotein from transposon 17.6 n=1 Tax=Trichonephila clavipes TaxID=2585209 RepID=A0A8X7BAA8_TRICX|nr:retrovirus-related Pol polyprotein from transposon 17.6 [Trichonephila clavipes]